MSSHGRLATDAWEHVTLIDGPDPTQATSQTERTEYTHAKIVCTTENLVYCHEWRKQERVLADVGCMRTSSRGFCAYGCKVCDCVCHDVILNVAKRKIPYLPDAKPFEDDSMQTGKAIEKTTRIIMDYATNIAILLETGHKDIVVHCKNGRSRSPAVIAMFYIMFRGIPVEYATHDLTEKFCKGRPDIAKKTSGDFPNFPKFRNCLDYAAEQRANLFSGRETSWGDRVRESCRLYNDWPERADRNLKKVDVDIIMEWLKCPVKDLKTPTQPREGERRRRAAAVVSTQRSAEMLNRPRTTAAAVAAAAAAAPPPPPPRY